MGEWRVLFPFFMLGKSLGLAGGHSLQPLRPGRRQVGGTTRLESFHSTTIPPHLDVNLTSDLESADLAQLALASWMEEKEELEKGEKIEIRVLAEMRRVV